MQRPESPPQAGFCVFYPLVFLLYLDEFGHDGVWDPADPKRRHHPLFGLAGLAVPGERARELDRSYLRLKLAFYKFELEREYKTRGLRPERFEPKQLSSRRDFVFASETLRVVRQLDGHVFAQGVSKVAGRRYGDALYKQVARRMLVAFARYLKHRAGTKLGCGVIVMDRRDEARDLKLLGTIQTALFSSTGFAAGFHRISETPLLVRSEWYHGVQAADTVGRVAGAVLKHRTAGSELGARLGRIAPIMDAAAYREDKWSSVYIPPRSHGDGAEPEPSGVRERSLSRPPRESEPRHRTERPSR